MFLVDLWQKGGDEKKSKTRVNFAKSKWQNEKSEENLTIFAEKWHFFRQIFGQVRKKVVPLHAFSRRVYASIMRESVKTTINKQ